MKTAVHQYEDKLLDYAYGELSALEAAAVSEHAKGCTRCASHLTQIESTRSFMKQLEPAAAPAAGLESLMAYAEQTAARNATSKQQSVPFMKRYFARLLSVAALAVVGVVAWQGKDQSLVPDLAAASFEQKNETKQLSKREDSNNDSWRKGSPAQAEKLDEVDLALNDRKKAAQEVLAAAPSAVPMKDAPKAQLKEKESVGSSNFADAKPPQERAEKAADLGSSGYEYKKSETPRPAPPKAEPVAAPAPALANKKQPDDEVGSRLSAIQNASPSGSSGGGYGLVPSGGLAEGNAQGRKSNEPVVAATKESQSAAAYDDRLSDKTAPASKKKSLGISSPASSDSQSSFTDELEAPASVQIAREESLTKRSVTKERSLDLDAARQAGKSGDRLMEIKYAKDVIASGATGYDRIEALKRLCDAYDALGNSSLSQTYCQMLIAEYPTSGAARSVAAKADREKSKKDAAKAAESQPAQAY